MTINSDFLLSTGNFPLPDTDNQLFLAGYNLERPLFGSVSNLFFSYVTFFNKKSKKYFHILSIDVLFVDDCFKSDLLNLLPTGHELIIFSTHTHSAPNIATSIQALGKVNLIWRSRVLSLIASKLSCFIESVVDKCSYSLIETDLNINRRKDALVLNYSLLKRMVFRLSKSVGMAKNPQGSVDNNLYTISFSLKSKLKLVLWSFAAHPTYEGQGGLSCDTSSSYPGYIREHIKKRYGNDVVVIFMPGLMGSSIINANDTKLHSLTLRQLILRLLPFNPKIPPISPSSYSFWLFRLTKRVCFCLDNPLSVSSDINLLLKKSASVPIFKSNTNSFLHLNYNSLSICNLIDIHTFSGEMLSEWYDVFNNYKKIISPSMPQLFLSYSAGDCLYIPTDYEITRGGYEVDRFKDCFGISGHFSSRLNDCVLSLIKANN